MLLALNLHCSSAPSSPFDDTSWAVDTELGISFEVPRGWTRHHEGRAQVLSGPAGDATFFTTIALQQAPSGSDLSATLTEMYEPLRQQPRFAWSWKQPGVVNTFTVLHYRLEFELHESMRRKAGLLVQLPNRRIDVSYGAPSSLYPLGLPAFDQVSASLSPL